MLHAVGPQGPRLSGHQPPTGHRAVYLAVGYPCTSPPPMAAK